MQRAGPHEGGPGRLRIARRTPRAARLRPRAAVRRERQSGCRCQRGTGRKPGVSSGAPTCRRGWLQPRRWDPSALRGKLPLAGQRLYANMTTTLREARDGVLGCSQAVAIVNHPRAARPRGAHWSPRGRSRGGPTLMPGATGVIRPRTIGWHHLSRTVARARSCARALVKNVGGEAWAPAASRAARARPIAVQPATGSSVWASASLRRGAIPMQADRVCLSPPRSEGLLRPLAHRPRH